MLPKPAHLGPAYAAVFTDQSVAATYPHRPPYPPDLFDLLLSLIPAGPRVALDVGCGTGDLARPLTTRVDRVDVVDPSSAMLTLGRTRPCARPTPSSRPGKACTGWTGRWRCPA